MRAGEVLRPGLNPGGIQGVAGRPDLEDDGVELELRGPVQDGQQLRFLLLRAERPCWRASQCSPTVATQAARNSRRGSGGRPWRRSVVGSLRGEGGADSQ